MPSPLCIVRYALLFFCLAVFGAGDIVADVKIKSRNSMGDTQSGESTTYIKGKRQRSEMGVAGGGPAMVSLTQCDLRRMVTLNQFTKTYTVTSFDAGDDAPAATTNASADAKTAPVTRGGTVTTTVTAKDTGERKQMFGYTARHIISSVVTESSPDACSPQKTRMETDGWYIDAAFALDCDMGGANYQTPPPTKQGGCRDKHQFKQLGVARLGYPVWTKTTMYDDKNQPSFSYVSEVIELSQTALDAALFEIPADYREGTGSASDMYSAAMAAAKDSEKKDSSSEANNNAGNAGASSAPTALGPKKAGVLRIGLTYVKTKSNSDAVGSEALSSAIRDALAENLKAARVETVTIEARLPAEIDAEAKQKECDYVVNASAEHKKGGGFGGGMFGKMSPIVSDVASMAGVHNSIAGSAAATTVYTAASVSRQVKAKDQLTFDFTVQAAGNAIPIFSQQVKNKAKSDGENIISPLAMQAAQMITDAVTKR